MSDKPACFSDGMSKLMAIAAVAAVGVQGFYSVRNFIDVTSEQRSLKSIQRWIAGRRICEKCMEEQRKASVTIQRHWRGYHVRKSSPFGISPRWTSMGLKTKDQKADKQMSKISRLKLSAEARNYALGLKKRVADLHRAKLLREQGLSSKTPEKEDEGSVKKTTSEYSASGSTAKGKSVSSAKSRSKAATKSISSKDNLSDATSEGRATASSKSTNRTASSAEEQTSGSSLGSSLPGNEMKSDVSLGRQQSSIHLDSTNQGDTESQDET